MKYFLWSAVLLSIAFISFILSQPEPSTITFAGEKWDFPSTVEEAVNAHGLLYKPPGYYYKTYSSGMKVILDFYYSGADVDNESQPKEVLFPRTLHSYIFQFENKAGVYDSLRQHLERTYGKKFVLTKGIKDSELAEVKEFAFDFLKVSPEVTVGIKTGYSPDDRCREVFRKAKYYFDKILFDTTSFLYIPLATSHGKFLLHTKEWRGRP